ncbi:MAG: hypothetical protein BGO54_04035 [Sphingobacteriales bacterium 46-32]|nr:MAG: hypothetical protein BGO54_04035 [Sphingobacteriales bacterium 46-32]
MRSRQRKKKKKFIPPPVKTLKKKITVRDIIVTIVSVALVIFLMICLYMCMKNHIMFRHRHPAEKGFQAKP